MNLYTVECDGVFRGVAARLRTGEGARLRLRLPFGLHLWTPFVLVPPELPPEAIEYGMRLASHLGPPCEDCGARQVVQVPADIALALLERDEARADAERQRAYIARLGLRPEGHSISCTCDECWPDDVDALCGPPDGAVAAVDRMMSALPWDDSRGVEVQGAVRGLLLRLVRDVDAATCRPRPGIRSEC